MIRYLVVLMWPVGLAVIVALGYLAARRAPDNALPVAVGGTGRRHSRRAAREERSPREAVRLTIKFAVISGIGAALAVGVMYLIGLVVVYHGHVIDFPIFTWMIHHQVHPMTSLMNRFTKIGDTWTTWGAAAAAAICLAVTYRTKRWLPPVVLAWAIFIDHYGALALRNIFNRLGPPTSPLGTYPSGGDDRAIFIFGVIGFLLWYQFSGKRKAAIWTATVVAALGFNEAYSRVYLSKHWFTDAVSGLLYGLLLLIPFIIAIYQIAGKPQMPQVGSADVSSWSPDLAPTGGGPSGTS